jgi:uncharacterized metal-binding protein
MQEVIMASGRVHAQAVIMSTEGFLVASAATRDINLLWMVAGSFTGLLINPDLDQDGKTISDFFVNVIPKIGKPIAWFWRMYTWLYRRFPHRSFWTHAPVIGTLIRVVYFGWWLYFVCPTFPLEFIIGLAAADTIHWLLDLRIFRNVL